VSDKPTRAEALAKIGQMLRMYTAVRPYSTDVEYMKRVGGVDAILAALSEPESLSVEDRKLVNATFATCMDRLVSGYRGTTAQRVESALAILLNAGLAVVRVRT